MEEALAGLQEGTLKVYLLEDGGMFTTTDVSDSTHYEITEDGVTATVRAQ